MYSPSAYSVYSHQQIQDPYISTDPYTVDSTTCYDLPRPSLSDNMHTVDTTGIIGNTISTGSFSPDSFSYRLPVPFTICAFHSLSYMLVILFNTYLLGNKNVLKTMLGPCAGFCRYKTSKVIFEHLSFSLQFKTKQNYRFRLSLKFIVKITRPIFPCEKYQ